MIISKNDRRKKQDGGVEEERGRKRSEEGRWRRTHSATVLRKVKLRNLFSLRTMARTANGGTAAFFWSGRFRANRCCLCCSMLWRMRAIALPSSSPRAPVSCSPCRCCGSCAFCGAATFVVECRCAGGGGSGGHGCAPLADRLVVFLGPPAEALLEYTGEAHWRSKTLARGQQTACHGAGIKARNIKERNMTKVKLTKKAAAS